MPGFIIFTTVPRSTKRKSALLYCLQVWLSCALLGAAIWYWIFAADFHVPMSFGQFYPIAFLAGLMNTFPSFLLLFGVVVYLNRRQWEPISKKLIVAAGALFCAIASCTIYFQYLPIPPALKELGTSIFISYCLPMMMAISLYRFSTPRTFSEDQPADTSTVPAE